MAVSMLLLGERQSLLLVLFALKGFWRNSWSTSNSVGGSLNSNLCMVSEKAKKYTVFYTVATINKGRRPEKELKVVDKLA